MLFIGLLSIVCSACYFLKKPGPLVKGWPHPQQLDSPLSITNYSLTLLRHFLSSFLSFFLSFFLPSFFPSFLSFLFFFFLFILVFEFFGDRASLYSSGCPGTHSADQTGLKPRNPPASASQVLGLKACATTTRLYPIFNRVIWFSGVQLLEFFIYIGYQLPIGLKIAKDLFTICWLPFYLIDSVFALQKLCNFMRSYLSILDLTA